MPLVVRDLRAMFLPGKQSKIESTQERRVKCDCSLVWLASCRQVEQRAGHFTEVDSLGAERCQAMGEIHRSAGWGKSPETTFKATQCMSYSLEVFLFCIFCTSSFCTSYLSNFTTNADAFIHPQELCLHVKGITHPKITILPLFTHPHVIPNLYAVIFFCGRQKLKNSFLRIKLNNHEITMFFLMWLHSDDHSFVCCCSFLNLILSKCTDCLVEVACWIFWLNHILKLWLRVCSLYWIWYN